MGYKFSFCSGCETRRSCDACLHLSDLEEAEREGRLLIINEGHMERKLVEDQLIAIGAPPEEHRIRLYRDCYVPDG